jgi:hypothetical protein
MEESHIAKVLSDLPRPFRTAPLRRLIRQYPSVNLIQRLLQFVSQEFLTKIGESIISDLFSGSSLEFISSSTDVSLSPSGNGNNQCHNSEYAGMVLKTAESIIQSFGFNVNTMKRCLLVSPDDVEEVNFGATSFELTLSMEENEMNDDEVENDANLHEDDPFDVYAAYQHDDFTKQSKNYNFSDQRKLSKFMQIRMAKNTGIVSLPYWKWILTQLGAKDEITVGCLHDLTLKFYLEEPDAEHRWVIAERQLDSSIKCLLSEGVRPSPRLLRAIISVVFVRVNQIREKGSRVPWVVVKEEAIVPARFIFVLSTLEDTLLSSAGPRPEIKPDQKASEPVATKENKETPVIERVQTLDEKFDGVIGKWSESKAQGSFKTSNSVSNPWANDEDNEANQEKSPAHDGHDEVVTAPAESPKNDEFPLSIGASLEKEASNDELKKLIEAASAIPSSHQLYPYISIILELVLVKDEWRELLGMEAWSDLQVFTPEARFYRALLGMVKDALEIESSSRTLFKNWESQIITRAPTISEQADVYIKGMKSNKNASDPPRNAVTSVATTNTNLSAPSQTSQSTTKESTNEKDAWDKAWNKLSSKLSTYKQ